MAPIYIGAGEGGGDADGLFEGFAGGSALSGFGGDIEDEEDALGGLAFELADHESLAAGGEFPVDGAGGIAGLVFTDGMDAGAVAFFRAFAAAEFDSQMANRGADVDEAGVDESLEGRRSPKAELEKAKRKTAGNFDAFEVDPSATLELNFSDGGGLIPGLGPADEGGKRARLDVAMAAEQDEPEAAEAAFVIRNGDLEAGELTGVGFAAEGLPGIEAGEVEAAQEQLDREEGDEGRAHDIEKVGAGIEGGEDNGEGEEDGAGAEASKADGAPRDEGASAAEQKPAAAGPEFFVACSQWGTYVRLNESGGLIEAAEVASFSRQKAVGTRQGSPLRPLRVRGLSCALWRADPSPAMADRRYLIGPFLAILWFGAALAFAAADGRVRPDAAALTEEARGRTIAQVDGDVGGHERGDDRQGEGGAEARAESVKESEKEGEAEGAAQERPAPLKPVLPPAESVEIVEPRRQEPLRSLQVGYLEDRIDVAEPERVLGLLRQYLLEDAAIVEALAERGLAGIELHPAGNTADLTQHLRDGELEVAFAPAVVYVRLLGHPGVVGRAEPKEDRTAYVPVFQIALEGDTVTERGATRKSAIFIGPASPLWAIEAPTPEAIRREIETGGLAISSSDSLATWFVPRILLLQELGELNPERLVFSGSSEEVVKHVVSGLVATGVAEKRILERLGRVTVGEGATERTVELYRTLLETEAVIPAAPLLVRRDLFNEKEEQSLGMLLMERIRSFFNESDFGPEEVEVVESRIEVFDEARRILGFLDEEAPEPGPGLGPTEDMSGGYDEVKAREELEGEMIALRAGRPNESRREREAR